MKDYKENLFSKDTKKSIFNYVTDSSQYKNNNQCENFTPPFIGYVPAGFPKKNVDVDSMLKGVNQYLSKCTEYKYRPEEKLNEDIEKLLNNFKKNECSEDYNIITEDYMPFDKYK